MIAVSLFEKGAILDEQLNKREIKMQTINRTITNSMLV